MQNMFTLHGLRFRHYPDSDPQSLLYPFLGRIYVLRLGSESVSGNVNKPYESQDVQTYGDMAETKASEGSPDFSHARLCTKWCTAALAIPYPIIPGTTTCVIVKFTHFYVPNCVIVRLDCPILRPRRTPIPSS